MKSCFKCKMQKPFSEFHKCTRDGYQSACKSCKRTLKVTSDAKYYIKNKNELNKKSCQYYKENREKLRPKMNAYSRRYMKQNRKACNAGLCKYRARKLQAMPPWADEEAIKRVYLNCPKGMEVDHILPLRGINVCGLHVEYNLQYLTPSENKAKGNKVLLEKVS